jgi:hypothetical protein
MTYQGTVQNGSVVLHDGASLPDGTLVSVVPVSPPVSETVTADAAPTVWQKLAELGRWAETQPCDLPSDLAANHDHYLHGVPKRQ